MWKATYLQDGDIFMVLVRVVYFGLSDFSSKYWNQSFLLLAIKDCENNFF